MNGSGNVTPETEPMVGSGRPMRPQYHFFYGSTSPGDDRSAGGPSTNTEQESLIGESLVPTDNEEEPPASTTSSFDLQHVLISNGDNGGMRHVVGAGNHMNGGSNHKRNSFTNGNGSHHHSLEDDKSQRSTILNCQGNGNQTMAHIIGLVGCMTICMVVFAVTLFPSGSQSSVDAMGAANSEKVAQFVQSFPITDRTKSSDPPKRFLLQDLIHPNLHYQGSDTARIFSFAFPTGAFWTNLVMPATGDGGFSDPIVVYPYAFQWSDTNILASYPYHHRKEEEKAIHDYFLPDLTFGVSENPQHRHITNFDPLSVTLQYTIGDQGRWITYLVQGSPYITMEYDSVTPQIQALSTFKNVFCPGEEGLNGGQDEDEFDDNFSDDDSNDENPRRGLLGVCGASTDDDGNTLLRGVQFVLQSQEGVNWIAFSSEPITFIFDSRMRTEIVSSKAFKGTIRLAIIPPSSKVSAGSNGMVQISSSTGLRRLVYHASVYPVAAKVDYAFLDPVTKTTTSSLSKAVLSGLTGGGGGSALTSSRAKAATSASFQRVGRVSFHFVTRGTNGNANAAAAATGKTTGLLMLSLPHQAVAFTRSHVLDHNHFDLVYHCIKGPMTPVVGSAWTYEEKLFQLGFDSIPATTVDESDYATTEEVLADHGVRKLLADNLETDLNIALPTNSENIYGFGKQVARLAQLAHIADRLVKSNGTAMSSANSSSSTGHRRLGSPSNVLEARLVDIRQTAADKLSGFLEMILTGQYKDSLLYDASLGGIVSSDGLADFNADFGNGRYNDHHFHYGYLLYASAVMGKLNATFVKAHGDKIDSIMHDVAYNTNMNDGSFFPLARHMNWFDGHSYASGLFPYGNGKSQESSSEAVNCYYGAYLWSLVRSGSQDYPNSDTSAMTDFARLLLAMEVRGAKTYWHMLPPTSSTSSNTTTTTTTTTTTATVFPNVYSSNFAGNYMVGNIGMLDAICSTWFGSENLYVHMINLIPVTSISRELFNKEYVTEEYDNVISQYADAEMAWRGFVVSDHALASPMEAWKEALTLTSARLDSGFSKTQALYFILTSPGGFDLSQIGSGGDDSGSASGGDDAACVNYDGCLKAGLQGLCCPTAAGVTLGCCASKGNKQSNDTSDSGGSDRASCSSHHGCSGLVGQCCPTQSGIMLGCCA